MDEAKDKLKQAGITEDEMAALEGQLLPAAANNTNANDGGRKVGFVSAGVESQADGGLKTTANLEDIALPEESDSEEEEKEVEIAQKEVPSAVFGGLVRKREEDDENGGGDDASAAKVSRLGALERIKRQKQV